MRRTLLYASRTFDCKRSWTRLEPPNSIADSRTCHQGSRDSTTRSAQPQIPTLRAGIICGERTTASGVGGGSSRVNGYTTTAANPSQLIEPNTDGRGTLGRTGRFGDTSRGTPSSTFSNNLLDHSGIFGRSKGGYHLLRQRIPQQSEQLARLHR